MAGSFKDIRNMARSGGKIFAIICLMLLSFLAQSAYAGEPTEQIKQSIDSVLGVLKNKALKGPKKTAERRAAIRKIERYSGEKIVFVDESVDDGYAEVKTKIIAETGSEIPINYLLLREGAKWAVYDVKIEGTSLIENYRSQFDDIISSSSYEELVRKLKEKVSSIK